MTTATPTHAHGNPKPVHRRTERDPKDRYPENPVHPVCTLVCEAGPAHPQGAGGVGGLLKVTQHGTPATHHFVAHDGNGNVVALVNGADGTETARYEYGPFGELIRAAGPLALANPFRFSTKFQDDETGLLYYGYRYYDPSTGRWLSRDPLLTGIDLDEATVRSQAIWLYHKLSKNQALDYVAFENHPTGTIDPLGLSDCKTVRFTRSDEHSLGGFAGFDLKFSADTRITVTTCPKCCTGGGSGADITTTVDQRFTIEAKSPEAIVPVLGVPVRVSIFGGGSGGGLQTTRADTCSGASHSQGCFFVAGRFGAQGCVGVQNVSEACLRCEANYTHRWCLDSGSSGCWSGRCMARFRFLTRRYDFVFWQTQPCSSGDAN